MPPTVQSSGSPLKVLKQAANNCFSGDVIPGRCSLLAENFFFAKFQNLTKSFVAAVLSILPLCQRSVSLVSTQISEPCYESSRATDTFIYSMSPRFRFRTNIPKLSLAVYPFSISLYEHLSLKFLIKKGWGKEKYIYQYKHTMILKIFTDVDLRINTSISKWIICKHNFSFLLLTLNVHFQIGESIPRGTCTQVCDPLV